MISWVLLTAGLLYGQAADSSYAAYMDSTSDSSSDKSSDSKSQAQSGNYQQYMEKYAGGSSQGGDYQQYMKKYAGGSQGGDYQQYMSKYAGGSQGGDYQKYMKKYADSSGGQGGDYQQYYEKYMNKYAKGSQGGSQSGDYEQYMKKYAGGKSGNYQQYMKKYAGGQGGDYQQYMSKYAGGKGAASGSSATELLEKSPEKGEKSADGSELNLQATDSTDSKSNYQQYMQQYAGGGGQGSYQKYMDEYAGKYAGSYEKYMDYQTFMKRYQNEHGKEIGSASDANTTTQLNEWYSGAKNSVQWYVPDGYSSYATHDIDKTYQNRLKEIQHGKGGSSPFVDTAMNLQEKPQTKNFLAQKATEAETTKDAETQHATKAEDVQSQVTANLQLLADQVKSDPVPCAGMALVGVAFAFIVFFAIRRRRSIQTPEIMLG